MHAAALSPESLALLILPLIGLLGGPPGGPEDDTNDGSEIGWLRSLGDHEALAQIMAREKQLAQGLDAAEALAELGDVRGLDHLIASLNSPSSHLRHQAAQILKRLNHPRGLRALHNHPAAAGAASRGALREQLHDDLNRRDTDELVALWHAHDRSQWSELAFEVMEAILTERLGSRPERDGEMEQRGPEGIDESADPRIQELWLKGDVEGLTDILEGDPDVSLRLEAAEALAYLGDEAALDILAEALDDPDEEYSRLAAELLDWLDMPRGNAALEDRGFEFETGAEDAFGPSASQRAATAPAAGSPAAPPDSWVVRSPAPTTSERPRIPGPQTAAPQPVWQQEEAAPSVPFIILTGAVGGVLGFILFMLGLQFFDQSPLAESLTGWLQPPTLFYLVTAVIVGASSGVVGSRLARGLAARLGWETGEGDLVPVLGALLEGATSAALADVLLFMLLAA